MSKHDAHVAELINEYFAAKATEEAARALVVEYMSAHGITEAKTEAGAVRWSNGYTKTAFDAKAFEAAEPETASRYQKQVTRKGSYTFRSA